jgi:quinol monooxygenase YgiN
VMTHGNVAADSINQMRKWVRNMARFAAMVKFTVKPTQKENLLSHIHALAAQVQDEDGTLLYLAHSSVHDENELWMYEMFSGQAALEAHRSSLVHDLAIQALAECLDIDPEVHELEVTVVGKGVPDE